jgi:hypothetical protein
VNAEDDDEAVAIERFHLVPCQAAERLVGWHVPPFEASAALVDPGAVVGSVAIAPLLLERLRMRRQRPLRKYRLIR